MALDLDLRRQAASGLSGRELTQILFGKLMRKFGLATSKAQDGRFHWTYEAVIDAVGPEALCRTYLEQRDVRIYLQEITKKRTLREAADIGSGFGRMTPVLSEFSSKALGFEREPALVDTACALNTNKAIEYRCIKSLSALPLLDGTIDFVLIFTVLQHLPDHLAGKVACEARRILSSTGFLLVVEQTDEFDTSGDISDESALIQRGRSVEKYEDLFKPLKLIKTSPRIVEPTYRVRHCGTYMLFNGS